jgi:hypothetical protein
MPVAAGSAALPFFDPVEPFIPLSFVRLFSADHGEWRGVRGSTREATRKTGTGVKLAHELQACRTADTSVASAPQIQITRVPEGARWESIASTRGSPRSLFSRRLPKVARSRERREGLVDVRDENGGGTAPAVDRRPFGAVVASAVDGFRTLARKHAELARLEITEAASVRMQGAGMLAAAAVVAMYAVGFGAAAGAAGLAVVLPTWAAILIVAALLAVVAGVLILVARRALRTAPAAAERTRDTLKEDARWAKRQIER